MINLIKNLLRYYVSMSRKIKGLRGNQKLNIKKVLGHEIIKRSKEGQ